MEPIDKFLDNADKYLNLNLHHIFGDIDNEVSSEILNYVSDYNKLFELLETQSVDLFSNSENNLFLLKEYLKHFKFQLCPSFFKNLGKDDIVEIYDSESLLQKWRSLNFYKHCKYTIRELTQNPFPELFSRPEKVTDQIINDIQVCLDEGRGHQFTTEPHYMMELKNNRRYFMTLKWIYPLFNDDGSVSNIISTLNIKSSPFLLV